MSYSNYLWTIARTLRERVHGELPSEEGRETVQNCVRVLTALANALEPDVLPEVPVPAAASGHDKRRCVVREALGPPENAALYLATEDAIADAAARIDRGALTEPAIVRDLVAWEHRIQTQAVHRMATVETAATLNSPKGVPQIDRHRLQAFLQSRIRPNVAIAEFRPALGGRSRQTALFSITGGDGVPTRLVVQRAIPGMVKGAAFCDPEVEFRVLETLSRAGLRVPRPLFLELDPAVLGAPFVVVEQSLGRLVQSDYWAPPDSSSVALQLAEQMAMLHSQPLEPLASMLPRSRTRSDRKAWLEELDRFDALWRAQSHGPSITMSATLAWLRANVDTVENRESLVHNDMVFHNILADNERITAILDWEQTSIGHPAEDLGYCFPVVSAAVDWQQFMDVYRIAGGAVMSQREIDYFSLRAVVRLMTLVQQGRHAFEGGSTDDILVAGAGAFFTQRLLLRQSQLLTGILGRS